MAKEVIAAAKDIGVTQSSIKSVQAQVNAIDIVPIIDLFDWNSSFFTWALRAIDVLQGMPLWVLNQIDPDNAAKLAAILQKIEDYIVAQQSE